MAKEPTKKAPATQAAATKPLRNDGKVHPSETRVLDNHVKGKGN